MTSAQQHNSTPSSSTDTGSDRSDTDRLVIVCALLSLSMVALIAPRVWSRSVGISSDAIRSVVDADTAPWWELTVLPKIGPVLAGEIIRYRKSVWTERSVWNDKSVRTDESDNARSRAFSQPNDLMRVHGIGPKTVQRISNDLDFGGD